MNISNGTYLHGKWTKRSFRVEKLLGQGANGSVYLVRTSRGLAAMKVCEEPGDIALEWALLDSLKNQPAFPAPMVIDDAEGQPPVYFYVMEWIPGQTLSQTMGQCAASLFREVVVQILAGLSGLHHTNKIFCDIKPENILIATAPDIQARFVDVGGVTPIGRAVRQFTPFYDRGFWGLGTRQADVGYDLCGLALALVLSCVESPPSQITSKTPSERQQWLDKILKRFPFIEYTEFLRSALMGDFPNAEYALNHFKQIQVPAKTSSLKKTPLRTTTKSLRPRTRLPKRHTGRFSQQRALDWTEWVMWISLCCSVVVTVAAWASFFGWL